MGKGKRADVYLEVMKRREHIFFIETSACGKDDQNIVFMWKSYRTSQCRTRRVKTYKRTKCWTPLYVNM